MKSTEQKTQDARAHLNSILGQIQQEAKELERLVSERTNLAEEVEGAKKLIAETRNGLLDLEEKQASFDAYVVEQVERLEQMKNSAKDEVLKAKDEIATAEQEKKTFDKSIKSLHNNFVDGFQKLDALNDEIEHYKEVNQALKISASKESTKLALIATERDALLAEIEELKRDAESKKQQYEKQTKDAEERYKKAEENSKEPNRLLERRESVLKSRHRNFLILAKRVERLWNKMYPEQPLKIETDISLDIKE